ncbi:MAG: DUF2269 family protein [Deltaproteobacteria bacterium]|jgi:uncharacterized membrane protein|nr:DUF2269 family protein [Deltaproteobacteria bacterium]
MYRWILLFHAIGGATLFGAHVYMESLMASAGRERDRSVYMTTMLGMSKTAGRILGPASIVTLAFGVWLVIDTAWDWEELFVTIGLVVIVAAFAISVFLISPRLKEIEATVDDAGLDDAGAVASMKSLGNLVHVQTALVALAFVVMILKPGV